MSFYAAKRGKYKYIFGPVPSRRLGSSLGVDIIPYKTCTLNCIYCEIGKTNKLTSTRQHFDNPDDIVAEFKTAYNELRDITEVVTITGSGEPTLNKDFGCILNQIKQSSSNPVAVLTNSTLITDEDVYSSLLNADIVVPSIDAATQEVFNKINLPDSALNIEEINESIVKFSQEFKGKMLLEILLVSGINDSMEEIEKIADIIVQCKYHAVQLNTVHRPPAFTGTSGVDEKKLLDIFLYLKSRGIKVEQIENFLKKFSSDSAGIDKNIILSLLEMRPCTTEDISYVFRIDSGLADEIIESLFAENSINKNEHMGKIFYFAR